MTWFHRYQYHPIMSLIYLSGIALMLPVLLTYYVGCTFWCLVIVISGKLLPEPPSPKPELSSSDYSIKSILTGKNITPPEKQYVLTVKD